MKKNITKFLIFFILLTTSFCDQNIEGVKGKASSPIKRDLKKQEREVIPELTGRIVDLTNTLSSREIQKLEKKIKDLEDRKGSQIAVLIIPTTGLETIEGYSIKVAEKWKIGRKGIDDGVILTIAKQDRRLRIEVGYGLEGVIPDAIAKRIIEEIIVPEFKKGNFYEGIDKGIDAIIKLIDGEPLPEPKKKDKKNEWIVIFVIGLGPAILSFVLHFFVGILRAIGISFLIFIIISIFIFGFNLDILVMAIPIFSFALLGCTWYWAFLPGDSSDSSGRSSSESSYSSSGSYSGSSYSSGGSFSGGGGSFGGGGASGSW